MNHTQFTNSFDACVGHAGKDFNDVKSVIGYATINEMSVLSDIVSGQYRYLEKLSDAEKTELKNLAAKKAALIKREHKPL